MSTPHHSGDHHGDHPAPETDHTHHPDHASHEHHADADTHGQAMPHDHRTPPWTKTTTFMVTANTPDTAPQCFGTASGGR